MLIKLATEFCVARKTGIFMPLDEIAENIIKFIGRMFLRFFIDVLFDIVFYFIGKCFLKIVTFGHYPPAYKSMEDDSISSVVGFLLVVIALTIIIVFI